MDLKIKEQRLVWLLEKRAVHGFQLGAGSVGFAKGFGNFQTLKISWNINKG